jgi:hypothetical protein
MPAAVLLGWPRIMHFKTSIFDNIGNNINNCNNNLPAVRFVRVFLNEEAFGSYQAFMVATFNSYKAWIMGFPLQSGVHGLDGGLCGHEWSG